MIFKFQIGKEIHFLKILISESCVDKRYLSIKGIEQIP